jgi:hypothetical protein
VGRSHSPALYELIEKEQIPLVNGWTVDHDHPYVGFDNAAVDRRLADYLLDLGHTRFGMITQMTQHSDRAADRISGVRAALQLRGLQLRHEHLIEMPHSFPGPPIVPGVPEETTMRYNRGGSAPMTGRSLVPARDVTGRRVTSPAHSMVRESSVTLVSGASCIPFERSSRFRRFPLVLPSINQPGARHGHAQAGRR